MKLAVIGGGGVRCILLAKSLAYAAPSVGLTDVVFMDNDEEKLNIFGKMARETSRRLAPSLNFSLTTDPVEAVRDADFVITTIRVGPVSYTHLDVYKRQMLSPTVLPAVRKR